MICRVLTDLVVSACAVPQLSLDAEELVGGDVQQGRSAIEMYGCGISHAIPRSHRWALARSPCERSSTTITPSGPVTITSKANRSPSPAQAGLCRDSHIILLRWGRQSIRIPDAHEGLGDGRQTRQLRMDGEHAHQPLPPLRSGLPPLHVPARNERPDDAITDQEDGEDLFRSRH